MTTIIAVQYEDKVVMGSDSLVTAHRKFNHPKMEKISKRNGYLIAGAGEVSACDIIQHLWQPPTPTVADKKNLYHFMIAKVVPSLKNVFKENDYNWEDNSFDEKRFSFLIAINGEVFDIGDDFAVCLDQKGFYGIGSGASIAIGALHTGATMERSLEIASTIDPYTEGPFLFFEQKKK
jgi:ATP-dependent protease HslVU (ClpYQ) peptidase subunit